MGGYDAAFDDPADFMRGTLELIAGHECLMTDELSPVHNVYGDQGLSNPAKFAPDTCPVCMARKCLDQIDAPLGVPGSTESAGGCTPVAATAPGLAESVAPDPSPVGSERSITDCTCFHTCAEDPRTACSLSGDWHQHEVEPCPVHLSAVMSG